MSKRAPDLPPEQGHHVVEAMRRLIATKYKTAAALARAMGQSPAAVGDKLSTPPKHGPSLDTAKRVARLVGLSVDELLTGAPFDVEQEEAYPERRRALQRLQGLLPSAILEDVRRTTVMSGETFSEIEWVELAIARFRDREKSESLERRVKPSAR